METGGLEVWVALLGKHVWCSIAVLTISYFLARFLFCFSAWHCGCCACQVSFVKSALVACAVLGAPTHCHS
jgi:hypothetical protein